MKLWFYYRVPCQWSSGGGKSKYAFARAIATIRGSDAVKEYVTCKMYLLAADFSFRDVAFGTTPVSKVETALPLFAVGAAAAEHADHVLVEIETEAEAVWSPHGSEYRVRR
jgi:hypothetical protein